MLQILVSTTLSCIFIVASRKLKMADMSHIVFLPTGKILGIYKIPLR